MKSSTKFLGIFIFSLFLMLGSEVAAETLFTDNFNDYSIGYLNTQGDWNASQGFIVVDNPVKEGARAVLANNFAFPIFASKAGTLLNDGQITVYVRRFDANQPGIFSFVLGEGANAKIQVRGNFAANAKFQYVDGSTGSYVNFGPNFTYETWYAVQIQWRSSDHAARYNIDNDTWTEWFPSIAPWTAGIDTVQMEVTNAIAFDAIQEKPISPEKTPVLIVPGLIGTELKNGSELLWLDTGRLALDIGDEFLDQLNFNSDLSSVNENITTGNLIGNILNTHHVYDLIITELISQGYVENENLFTFPYDWRYGVTGKYPDNKTNVDLIAEKIAAILAQTGADKVDVVAHSMGGLITKRYVASHVSDNHIGKAVFVGVPNTGAPSAVKNLLVGDNLGMFFVSDTQIKKISANMPAIYDLLPSEQYYNVKGSYIQTIDQGLTGISPTVTDLTYAQAKNFLTQDHGLNSLAVTNAENLHTQSFDNFDMRTAGVDVYAIDGCKAGTLGKVFEVRTTTLLGHDVVTYQKPQFIPGDGTVPLESSTNLPVDSAKKYYSLVGEHGKMLSQDGSRQQIVNILAGSTLQVDPNKISQNISSCTLNGRAISVFSPVDIFVTDELGNTLGFAEDGSVMNQIPNAAFHVWGEHKFVYLPTGEGQVYDIAMDGTGTGTYTIKTDDIENGQVVQTEVFSNLPVTADLVGSIELSTQTTLTVQQNSGSVPETILPSSVVVGEAAHDVVPPEVIITSPADGASYTFKQPVMVSWMASDALSGMQSASGSVVSGGLLEVNSLGNKTFSVTAVDNAGNTTLKTANYNVVPYVFGGFGPVLTIKKKELSKMGNIPVKFSLKDVNGVVVSNAVAMLKVNGVNAVSSGGSNVGNLFKFDSLNLQYVFNLSTKSLTLGKNVLTVHLDDGTSYSWTVTVK